jgi:SpoVK/Ycf46/Vps4 family AAA+-type ATPase
MSKVEQLLENLTQFTRTGNLFRSAGTTEKILEAGVYNIGADMRGLFFEKVEVKTDALIKINTSKYNYLMEEINKFWESKNKFTDLGFVNKRAFIVHSAPGMGKSCVFKQVMENMVKASNITFIATHTGLLAEAVKEFREVEPERKLLVILEELDEMVYNGGKALSDLLDGPNSIGDVFYLASTNYIDRIPARMKRPSRFDRIVEMGPPSEEDRYEYFKAKLGLNEEDDKIRQYAKVTKDYSFAHMKEFLVSVCCLGNTIEDTLERLNSMAPEGYTYGGYDESKFQEEFKQLQESALLGRINRVPLANQILQSLNEGK